MGAFYPRQTKHLFADLSVFGEGDEATSPSLVAENGAIDASSSSLEALIATFGIWRGDAMGALYPRQTKCLFADLSVFTSGERATKQRRPLWQLKSGAIEASSSSLEALIGNRYMQRGCDVSTLTTANKIPVCRSLSVYKRRGRRGNVALFYSLKRSDWLPLPARRMGELEYLFADL